jgi:hypothetical protein
MSTTIITIMPDFGFAWGWVRKLGRSRGIGPNFASDNYWGRDETVPQSLLDRFQVWQGRFELITREPELDWANFHEQGLGLCLELRQYIHEDIRMFYAKPIEDPCFEPDGEGDCPEDYWEIMPNGEARVVEDEEMQRLWQVNSPN